MPSFNRPSSALGAPLPPALIRYSAEWVGKWSRVQTQHAEFFPEISSPVFDPMDDLKDRVEMIKAFERKVEQAWADRMADKARDDLRKQRREEKEAADKRLQEQQREAQRKAQKKVSGSFLSFLRLLTLIVDKEEGCGR
ncbi:MAG TPA: hypothetical protein VGO47_07130 [Chlamydiales bacterium]|nr:hypothetical protein [Chlamydiales bacterium]